MGEIEMDPKVSEYVTLFTSEAASAESIKVPTAKELHHNGDEWKCTYHDAVTNTVKQWPQPVAFKIKTPLWVAAAKKRNSYNDFRLEGSEKPDSPKTPWVSKSDKKDSDLQVWVKYLPAGDSLLLMHVTPLVEGDEAAFPLFPGTEFMLKGYSECENTKPLKPEAKAEEKK